MDGYRPTGDGPEGDSQKPEDWIAEFRRQAEEVRAAADEWAVRWNEPEGRFISAMLGMMQAQSKLVMSAQASLQATMRLGRDHAEQEFRAARKLKESVEVLTAQTRNVRLLAVVQQENAVQRMIKETLPMFAESLKGALVIREARWNRRKARLGFAFSGIAFLAVFCAGYGLAIWSNRDRLAVYDRCLASTVPSSDGHVYCQFDTAMAAQPAAQAKPGK